jgi:hypothetical protein
MKTKIILCFSFFALILQAQWKPTKGPYGGYIDKCVNQNSSTYVTTPNGLYRSDDGGKNWKLLDHDLPDYYAALSVCVNEDEVFMTYSDYKYKTSGLVYSNDKGEHWIKRPLTGSREMAYSNGILLAWNYKEILESNDKGITWSPSSLKINYASHIRANHSYFFVSDSKRIYRRAIADTSWQLIYSIINQDHISTLYVTDSIIIMLLDHKPGFHSIDNGLSWQNISIQGFNGESLIADFGDKLYFSNSTEIYKSTDKGLTWNYLIASPTRDLHFYSLIRAGNSLLGADHNLGLVRTENEFINYETSSTGIYASNVARMFPTDSFLFAIGYQSVERYDYFTKKWNEKSLLIGENLEELHYFNGRLFILPRITDHLFISKNQGQSFYRVDLPLIILPSTNPENIKFIHFNDKLILQLNQGYLISDDFGDSWQRLDFKNSSNKFIYPFDIAPFKKMLVAAAYDQSLTTFSYYTTSDLLKWDSLPLINPPNKADKIFYEFTVSKDKLFFAIITLNGCTLNEYNPNTSYLIECKGLADICHSLFYFRNRIIDQNDTMLICLENGYYKSFDAGLNWVRATDNLNTSTLSFFTDLASKDQIIYASTYDKGVLKTNWDELYTIVNTKNNNSEKNENIISYPNPTSGIIELFGKYLENRKTDVLQIYNLQGLLVFETKDHFYPGYKLNIESLNAGLYFLKIGNTNKSICKLLIQK